MFNPSLFAALFVEDGRKAQRGLLLGRSIEDPLPCDRNRDAVDLEIAVGADGALRDVEVHRATVHRQSRGQAIRFEVEDAAFACDCHLFELQVLQDGKLDLERRLSLSVDEARLETDRFHVVERRLIKQFEHARGFARAFEADFAIREFRPDVVDKKLAFGKRYRLSARHIDVRIGRNIVDEMPPVYGERWTPW